MCDLEPKKIHWQRRVRTVVLMCAVGTICVRLLLQIGHVELPRRLFFPLMLLLLACPTLVWWSWLDERLAAARRDWLRLPLALYLLAVTIPIGLVAVGWRFYDRLPVPLLMWLIAWHMCLGFGGMVAFAVWVAFLIRVQVDMRLRYRAGGPARAEGLTDPPVGVSRRSFLTGAITAAPLVIAAGTVAGGLRGQGRFIIRKIEMRLPHLPARLSGLTITHVSDFHVGRLFRPEHLPEVVDAVNKLKSDIIAVTGDTVDHDVEFWPPACQALAGMDSSYGRYVVIGNHDLIDSPDLARHYLRHREPNFLEDDHRVLDIDGERLQIVGLDWSRQEHGNAENPGHYERVAKVMAQADRDGFVVALAHHPHAFDALAGAGVDLTLAGHTHGGQFMLTPPGFAMPVGAGNLLFRYIWGEYRRGESAMYVSSGVGNWFPVRVNAPAEVVQIRLVT